MAEEHARIERELAAVSTRLQSLEAWRAEMNTNSAVRTERDKHLDKRFDKIETDVGEIKGYLLKIVWVIILGIVGAFITFVVRGGLSV